MNHKLNVIDVFSGAGGLSEGFMQTNHFNFLAHIEWELPMVKTLRENLIKRWNYNPSDAQKTVVHFDVQKTSELLFGNWDTDTLNDFEKHNHDLFISNGLNGVIEGKTIDVIIGGPPCQAYSIAGRAQDPNSMKDDYRNYLFESFIKIVDHYKPSMFVFENVPGILSATPGDTPVLERIYKAFEEINYEIREPIKMKKSVYLASDFGVPQARKRVIIFGVKKGPHIDLESLYKVLDEMKTKSNTKTVRDAIGHLPKFYPLDQPQSIGGKNISHIQDSTKPIPFHEARYHNLRDISIFKRWVENNMNAINASEKLAFYKSQTGKESNHNKYRSLDWDKPSPTIVSHLYKDGLMFIHPDAEQARSLTVKEAALLQTFPNDYEFIGSNASAFKMIGNAVPVLFSKKIASAILQCWRHD